MTVEFFPFPFLISLLVLGLLLVAQSRRKRGLWYLFCCASFWLYLQLVLLLMFFPIRIPEGWPEGVTVQDTLFTLSHINLIPFYYGDLLSMNPNIIVWEVVGNVLLTVPLGLGLPFLVRVPPQRMPWLVLAGGLVFEAGQLAFKLLGLVAQWGHSVDINDVLLNGSGVLIGYTMYLGFAWCVKALTGPPRPAPAGAKERLDQNRRRTAAD